MSSITFMLRAVAFGFWLNANPLNTAAFAGAADKDRPPRARAAGQVKRRFLRKDMRCCSHEHSACRDLDRLHFTQGAFWAMQTPVSVRSNNVNLVGSNRAPATGAAIFLNAIQKDVDVAYSTSGARI